MKQSTECRRVQELLPLYIDGDMPGAELAEISSHLDKCPECSAELESLRRLEESLQSLPGLLPDPRALAGTVSRRLGLRGRRRIAPVFSRLSLAWSFAVATAAIVLIVSRFDYVSALLSGQESFTDTAARTMDYWIESSSVYISGFISRIDIVLSADPWILTAVMTGFGFLVFAAGMVAALRTMR